MSDDWRNIDSIPIGETVTVLTVRGIVCPARVAYGSLWIMRSDKYVKNARVHCFRTDKSSDVMAIKWKPL